MRAVRITVGADVLFLRYKETSIICIRSKWTVKTVNLGGTAG
jgi:hypothetical protein